MNRTRHREHLALLLRDHLEHHAIDQRQCLPRGHPRIVTDRTPSWRVRALIMLIHRRQNIMSNELVAPDKFFLNRFGMNPGALARILRTVLERTAAYADR